MRFSILGPLEVRDDAGLVVPVTRRLHRLALSLLLLNAGRPCSAASMTAALWDDDSPESPSVSLRSCVYGIRKLLPDAARLRTSPSGYLFIVRPGELDLHEFADLASRGRAALDAGDPRGAAALLGRALMLWREPALADAPAVLAADRVLDQRTQVREALADARLALGQHRQLLAELRGAVDADPLREHVWVQLITALYRSGARADALAAFGRLRTLLISEYGIEPGPELQELHKKVLADDPALLAAPGLAGRATAPGLGGQATAPGLAGQGTAVRADQPIRGPALGGWLPVCQLPAATAVFTGRVAELDRLLGRLSGQGMAVTVVTGMLGTGKTALAVHAAHLARAVFPDGQLYACLDDGGRPRDPQVVLGELLRGLGVPAQTIPAARFEREALYRSVLAGRRVLVLADGASSASQVRPLLPGTAGSAVVVTSRARLPELDGARRVELGGLNAVDAVTLLARISGRDVSGSCAEAAIAIAAACGQLPLALRIAGTRLADEPALTVTALAARLADERRRLDELEVGEVSMRGALVAAARAVSVPARRALALLAASRPADSQGSAIPALLDDGGTGKIGPELADAGLLHRVPGSAQPGSRSYLIHPLVWTYAGELLAAAAGASSSLITTRVGERRTTSRNPARS